MDKKREIDEKVIKILENVLADARAGKVGDLVIGWTDGEKGTWTASSYESWIKALGLTTMMQHDVMADAAVATSPIEET